MSEQKIFNPNIAVKMVQNRCKSAKTSTNIAIDHNIANLKPLFNFMLVLTIKGDILGAFGALHV